MVVLAGFTPAAKVLRVTAFIFAKSSTSSRYTLAATTFSERQARFLEVVQLIAHRLPQLVLDRGRIDARERTGDEAALGRAVQRVAREDTRDSRSDWAPCSSAGWPSASRDRARRRP